MMATGPPSSKRESPGTMLPALGTTASQDVDKTTRNNETTSAVLLVKLFKNLQYKLDETRNI
jgi:hypothetical protein